METETNRSPVEGAATGYTATLVVSITLRIPTTVCEKSLPGVTECIRKNPEVWLDYTSDLKCALEPYNIEAELRARQNTESKKK